MSMKSPNKTQLCVCVCVCISLEKILVSFCVVQQVQGVRTWSRWSSSVAHNINGFTS